MEELHDADLLLHVVDASSPRLEEQIKTVEQVLTNLDLRDIPTLLVFNKTDLLDHEEACALSKKMGGVAISAIHPPSLLGLIKRVEDLIWSHSSILQT